MAPTYFAIDDAISYSNSNFIISTQYPLDTSTDTTEFTKIEYATYWISQYVIIPLISIPGILGNVVSSIVIVKSGLKRSSNIFLLGLAIADILTLINLLDVSEYLYLATKNCTDECRMLLFPYEPALTILILQVALFAISAFGARMSTTVTVIITAERLVAVFYPLKLSQIVTRNRAWLILTCAVLFWLPWTIFQCFWFNFSFSYSEMYGTDIASVSNSEYISSERFDIVSFNNFFISHLSHTIPLAIVATGSAAIGIQIRIVMKKRQKHMSSVSVRRSTSRTTKTLLMVCVVYSITRFCFVLRSLPWFDFDNPAWSSVSLFYGVIRDRLIDVNSACNFFIYVAFNSKFRHKLNYLFFRNQKEDISETSEL